MRGQDFLPANPLVTSIGWTGESRTNSRVISHSSSIAESAVNQIISARMVKKQQMRWTPQGAHLLLQLRTRVLNDDLADDFSRWYPGFNQLPAPAPT